MKENDMAATAPSTQQPRKVINVVGAAIVHDGKVLLSLIHI